ncbi:MAG TPA: short-chain dehydrogenase [Bacteroidota bacterium]|nr:short-chain dehydrogenase [Bacteroidota bacterium]
MDIQNKTVLVLGGWGLVGSAVCRKLVTERPRKLIVTSLLESEAREAVRQLLDEFPRTRKSLFVPWWGNIFLRHSLKDRPRDGLLKDPSTRAMLIDDLLDEFTQDVLERSAIFHLLKHYRPEIIVDCINSATAIAYQDLFEAARVVRQSMKQAGNADGLIEATERLLAVQYTPQLIRHVQLLYRSMQIVGTRIYVKVGTSGTGGMGLNIPYTHSEERPSSVLLSKSSVAGAHTMLLFLMGRTPDAPITKEIKPTAAIAWKKIGYGEIRKRGKAIELVDCPPESGTVLDKSFELAPKKGGWKTLGGSLEAVFIDTGENGTFSRAEFEAISTPGQMEFVTPEEISDSIFYEIRGGNTGHDIINALDNATLNPTYRAGFTFDSAMKQLKALEADHGVTSVAFEILGPPRLSKLLYEAHLLHVCFRTMKEVVETSARMISEKVEARIRSDAGLRSRIISIGIPILLADGRTLLRGREVKIPPNRGQQELPVTEKSVNQWAHDGWVDLRKENLEHWRSRFTAIMDEVGRIPKKDTSSRYFRTRLYWDNFKEIDAGKLVGWIFSEEERGMRMKA